MKLFRRQAILSRATRPVTHAVPNFCEQLESRRLLSDEPTLVLVEPGLEDGSFSTLTELQYEYGVNNGWLLDTTDEVEWNLEDFDNQQTHPWDGLGDEDKNGYAGIGRNGTGPIVLRGHRATRGIDVGLESLAREFCWKVAGVFRLWGPLDVVESSVHF